jgi:hypothetical protein
VFCRCSGCARLRRTAGRSRRCRPAAPDPSRCARPGRLLRRLRRSPWRRFGCEIRPSMPTRWRPRRRCVRLEPAEARPVMKMRSGASGASASSLAFVRSRRRGQPPAARARAAGARRGSAAAARSREHPHPARRRAGVGRAADFRLHHRRVDPDRPRPEARLPLRLPDHQAGKLGHRLRPQPPGQLADRRLVRQPPVERDQAEAAQMQRVGNLAQQRLVAPSGATFPEHRPRAADGVFPEVARRSGLPVFSPRSGLPVSGTGL